MMSSTSVGARKTERPAPFRPARRIPNAAHARNRPPPRPPRPRCAAWRCPSWSPRPRTTPAPGPRRAAPRPRRRRPRPRPRRPRPAPRPRTSTTASPRACSRTARSARSSRRRCSAPTGKPRAAWSNARPNRSWRWPRAGRRPSRSSPRGLERGGRQWTAARKKDSLQRVLEANRSDIARLHQRMKQLVASWDGDVTDDTVAVDASADVPQRALDQGRRDAGLRRRPGLAGRSRCAAASIARRRRSAPAPHGDWPPVLEQYDADAARGAARRRRARRRARRRTARAAGRPAARRRHRAAARAGRGTSANARAGCSRIATTWSTNCIA